METDCIYCGLRGKKGDEHVVQRALGGVDKLTTVCGECNSKFKDFDKTLVVYSPLSIYVRRELNGEGPNTWDIDHSQHNLLLEAQTTPGDDSVTLEPQIIFDKGPITAYFNQKDLEVLGVETLLQVFSRRLRWAHDHYKIYGADAKKKDHKGQDMLKLVHQPTVREGHRLLPRIFTKKQMRDFDSDPIMFNLKYPSFQERDRVLDRLVTLNWESFSSSPRLYSGSHEPELRLNYPLNDIVQALTKVGLNLLAFHCSSTNVNRRTFSTAVQLILNENFLMYEKDFKLWGFVRPEDVAELNCPAKSHKFRLVHERNSNTWKFYAAFFEGRIGSYVTFFGPNDEHWATMDVIQPYKQRMRPPVFDKWYRPLSVNVETDPLHILSGLPLVRSNLKIVAGRSPQRG